MTAISEFQLRPQPIRARYPSPSLPRGFCCFPLRRLRRLKLQHFYAAETRQRKQPNESRQ